MKTACVIRQIIYMNDLFYTHLALCMTALINPTAIPSFRLTNLSFRIFLVCGFILCRNLKISIIFNQYSRLFILTFHRYTNSLRYSIILFFPVDLLDTALSFGLFIPATTANDFRLRRDFHLRFYPLLFVLY